MNCEYPNLEFFCGKKRSGKDYCVGALIAHQGGIRLSFSDELRRVANFIYPWCPINPADNEKDIPIQHPDNIHGYTPRGIWLHLGSDNGLRKIQPGLFLQSFMIHQLPLVVNNPDTKFYITDLRTPSEYEWAKTTKRPITRISTPYRGDIIEDDIEAFIDEMKVDFEYMHMKDGPEPFIEFYRNNRQ